MIPEFQITLPVISNRWLVGIVFQTHLVIVAAIVGVSLIAPAAEMLGWRAGGERWTRLSHHLSAMTTHFFALGATFAVFGIVALLGLYPRVLGYLVSIFYWPLIVVGGLWIVMSVTEYLYYGTWGRLASRRGLHVAIGWLFALATVTFITLITFLSSYQLTPTSADSLAAAALNPSWLPEIIHRHVGNLSYAGYILAAYAGLKMLFFRDGDGENGGDYYAWLAHVGIVLGVSLQLVQPFVGAFYTLRIRAASPDAFARMMTGDSGWMFLFQMLFFGATLVLANVYFGLATRQASDAGRDPRPLLVAVLAFAFLGIVPREVPVIGAMSFKYVALLGLFGLTLANLVSYLRASRLFTWEPLGRRRAAATSLIAVTIFLLMVTMGVIRSSARGGDPIHGRMLPGQSQDLGPP